MKYLSSWICVYLLVIMLVEVNSSYSIKCLLKVQEVIRAIVNLSKKKLSNPTCGVFRRLFDLIRARYRPLYTKIKNKK